MLPRYTALLTSLVCAVVVAVLAYFAICATDNPIRRSMVSAEFRRLETRIAAGSDTASELRVRKGIHSVYGFESLRAITTVRDLGPKGAFAVQDLVAVFPAGRHVCRREIALALSEIGPAASDAVPMLVRALNDPASELDVTWFAADALGNIGVKSEEVVQSLEAARRSDDAVLSENASAALRKLSKHIDSNP